MRSRHDLGKPGHVRPGITSACAEQTPTGTCSAKLETDHLRVCGADLDTLCREAVGLGSPPRVRSRPVFEDVEFVHTGITSACAEQTRGSEGAELVSEDHLRVCGADPVILPWASLVTGSPPRVRSRQLYFTVF